MTKLKPTTTPELQAHDVGQEHIECGWFNMCSYQVQLAVVMLQAQNKTKQ